jgi:hypothetical protein
MCVLLSSLFALEVFVSCEKAKFETFPLGMIADSLLAPQFAIDLLCGTFYSVVAFTIFERVRLRKLDLRHYSEGLTTGYDRLFHSLHDGENYTEYGSRQILRLSNGNKEELSSEVLSRSSSGGSVRLGNATRGGSGYAAVPTDRTSWEDEGESFGGKETERK